MITIDLGEIEYFDGEQNKFVYKTGGIVRFEYSLKVLYDWEGKWRKPFLAGKLEYKELKDFYLMMALDPIDEEFMTEDVMKQLSKYIEDSNTATRFSNPHGDGHSGSGKPKVYTAEELYAIMFNGNVDISFENRNLNRLFVVLKIMSSYNNPPKKMSRDDIYKQNAKLNAMRKKQMKSKG